MRNLQKRAIKKNNPDDVHTRGKIHARQENNEPNTYIRKEVWTINSSTKHEVKTNGRKYEHETMVYEIFKTKAANNRRI